MSGILECGLDWRFCKVLWANGFSDSGDLGLNTDWSCKFRAFALSGSEESVFPFAFKDDLPLESCLECLSREYSIFLCWPLEVCQGHQFLCISLMYANTNNWRVQATWPVLFTSFANIDLDFTIFLIWPVFRIFLTACNQALLQHWENNLNVEKGILPDMLDDSVKIHQW